MTHPSSIIIFFFLLLLFAKCFWMGKWKLHLQSLLGCSGSSRLPVRVSVPLPLQSPLQAWIIHEGFFFVSLIYLNSLLLHEDIFLFFQIQPSPGESGIALFCSPPPPPVTVCLCQFHPLALSSSSFFLMSWGPVQISQFVYLYLLLSPALPSIWSSVRTSVWLTGSELAQRTALRRQKAWARMMDEPIVHFLGNSRATDSAFPGLRFLILNVNWWHFRDLHLRKECPHRL